MPGQVLPRRPPLQHPRRSREEPDLIKPGRHLLAVTQNGFSAYSHEIEIDRDEAKSLDVKLDGTVQGQAKTYAQQMLELKQIRALPKFDTFLNPTFSNELGSS